MHALLLTVLTLGAQPGSDHIPAPTSQAVPARYVVRSDSSCGCSGGYSGESSGEYSQENSEEGEYGGDCGDYYGGEGGSFGGRLGGGGMSGRMRRKHGPMPQSCYAPRYGCYSGNDRYMHRYPAFHDNYYRRPYSYRHAFEYPWHAELHEPTSLWSYNVAEEEPEEFDSGDVPVPPLGAAPPAIIAPRQADASQREDQESRLPDLSERSSPEHLGEETRQARVMSQEPSQELASILAVRAEEVRQSLPAEEPAEVPAEVPAQSNDDFNPLRAASYQ